MAIRCEVCGGASLVKDGESFRCSVCGIQYSKEEVKKMVGSPENRGQSSVNADFNQNAVSSETQTADFYDNTKQAAYLDPTPESINTGSSYSSESNRFCTIALQSKPDVMANGKKGGAMFELFSNIYRVHPALIEIGMGVLVGAVYFIVLAICTSGNAPSDIDRYYGNTRKLFDLLFNKVIVIVSFLMVLYIAADAVYKFYLSKK